jgi:hypothetical protein
MIATRPQVPPDVAVRGRTSREAGRTPEDVSIDVTVVTENRHAVVVVTGTGEAGCRAEMERSLRVGARAHTVVDVRQLDTMTPDVAKALLAGLGVALDHRRTLRLVVRDDLQRRTMAGYGLAGLLPMHTTIAEATAAIEVELACVS